MREYLLSIGEKEYKAKVSEITAEFAVITVDGKEYKVDLKQLGVEAPVVKRVERPAGAVAAAPVSSPKHTTPSSEAAGGVVAPLPGLILEVLVKEGDTVKAGQDLLVMEAMKMENRIQAPHDGTVKKIFVLAGGNVAEGDQLIEVSRPLMTTL